jgi:hypothetical protein
MTAGVPLTGVSQTIFANVATIGNYNIGAVANGVIFSAAGTFTSTGTQNVVLAASGTPLLGTSNTFSLNTIPNCSFDWTTSGASTNGTAVVSNYRVTNGTDIMFTGNPVTGITQNIDAFVTTPGAYNIKAVANGVTFAATGTFAGTGTQTIGLIASGTPLLPSSFDFTINTTPGITFNRTFYDQSSNGLAVISGYSLGTLVGTMTAGVPVSGVTQNITANVTTPGTYTIATNTVNGVTFSAAGTFASTGNQTIALTASGTPIVDETDAFTINTNPNLTFNLTTAANPSSRGSAIVSAYTIGSSTGTMYTGVPVSGVSQTITANVTTAGTYNLSVTVSGVTFAASGTFSSTGNQTITLNATGTPTTVSASATFNITTTPNISFSRIINSGTTNGLGIVSSYTSGTSIGTMYVGVTVSGVTQNITANVTTAGTYTITTNTVNGVTFAGSGTFGGTGNQTITLTASGTPIAISALDNFTLNTTISGSFTRTTVDASTNGIAIVSGYTLGNSVGTMTAGVAVSGVTQTISANVTTAGSYTITTNTANGVKFSANGTFAQTGAQDIVLTATGTPTSVSASDNFTINTNPNITFTKATIANPSTNGSAVVTYASSTSTGTMYVGVPVSGVTQTITATVTTIGTYSISTTANGVTFAGSGTFTGTGSKPIVLTASGTPTAVSASDNFITNTTPSFTFTRTTVENLTSNGTAVVSAYTNGTSAGTLYRGVAVTGVTQTMIANVTTAGTYSITIPTTNGVIFAASGTFTGTGNQTITLIASGTPTGISTNTFTLNTTPNGSFTRTTVEISSGGTAVVTGYTSISSAGNMNVGVSVSGVTQTIRATISTTTSCTYNISAIANGVTFSGSGTFTSGTANRTLDIVLTASGTPTAAGTNGFTINTTPTLTFNRTTN